MHIKNLFLLFALIIGLNLIPGGRIAAQTFSILHRFDSYDGFNPVAELIISGNTLYGTTAGDSYGSYCTLFAVNTDGTGFTNLHNFAATSNYTNSDGSDLEAGLILSGRTLYGTAAQGGSSGVGTVFAVNTNGTGFTNLHSFAGNDGYHPEAGLILSGNRLYGTAQYGGSSGNGTVFAVNIDGSGFTNLYSFTASSNNSSGIYTNSDGSSPRAKLSLSGDTLYGTAAEGGSSGNGTVFALNTNGTGFRILHSFTDLPGPYYTNNNGGGPIGLILSGNTVFGTAGYGGHFGGGTVFAVSTDGTGFRTLHSFAGISELTWINSDGAGPIGLILSGNTLYGTAFAGGNYGSGTLFAVNTDGTSFTNLHNFSYGNGAFPLAGLVLSGNTLYGTASDYFGGEFGIYGTVFSLSLPLSLPTVVCSAPLVLECTGGAAVGTVQAQVEDTNGNPLQVVWTIDGTPFQTNDVLSGGSTTASNVIFTANFGLGEHVVVASASNGQTDPVTCSTTVSVHDTTPPRIKSIVANPYVLWPPNHRMVPVSLKVEAVDNCDSSPMAKITNVTCNEPGNPIAPDWEITGAQTLNLRAERLGKGPGRVYTIVVECKDGSGNVSIGSIDVTVPHN